MEKKKLILLLPLSLAFFSLCRDKATPLFFFFFFLLLYLFHRVCIRLIIASSFSKRFLFEKAHSLLNAAGRDGFSFGERKLPCGILRFTTIGAVADNFHVRRQDGVQGHGQDRTDGVRRGQ